MKVAIARYIKMQDNYFFDLFDAITAGTLNELGHDAIVVERMAADGFSEEDLMEGLVAFLKDFQPALVFLPYLPTTRLARRIREETGAWLAAFGSILMLNCEDVDYVIQEPDPLACVELVEALSRNRKLATVAALAWRDGEEIVRSPAPLHPIGDIMEAGIIDYESFYRLGPGQPTEVRKHIAGDWGCGYKNKEFSPETGLEGMVPDHAPQGGCTFCLRPCSTPMAWEEKGEMLERQLDSVLEAFPDMKKLIVVDEGALAFVDKIAGLMATKPTEGIELLVSGRLNYLPKYRDRLEAALEILSGTNTIRLYQFGLENLSDSVLKRYNKGQSFQQIQDACKLMFKLIEKHENLEAEESFGFIMFDPWTTWRELKENVVRARQFDISRLRSSAPYTAMRLYPEAPLYWRALKEGLLTGRMGENDFGYSVGSGWNFKHEATARIHDELMKKRGSGRGWENLARVLPS